MTFAIDCRCDGPMPVEFVLEEDLHVSMTCIRQCHPGKEWRVAPELVCYPHTVGSGERRFPGVSISARVVRIPFYHVVYTAVPFGDAAPF